MEKFQALSFINVFALIITRYWLKFEKHGSHLITRQMEKLPPII